jgi:hypothetical protein
VVNIAGSSSLLAAPTGPVLATLPGGILALPTNIGHQSKDDFSVIPEAEIRLGYQVTKHLSAFVGYNFMYWSSVVRPGEQINRNLTPTIIPSFFEFTPGAPATQPAPLFKTTDFWAQGINFGMELRF